MKNEKLGQEPAFPQSSVCDGMNKRLYAACTILAGVYSNSFIAQKLSESNDEKINLIPEYVKMAYETADELLKQENL